MNSLDHKLMTQANTEQRQHGLMNIYLRQNGGLWTRVLQNLSVMQIQRQYQSTIRYLQCRTVLVVNAVWEINTCYMIDFYIRVKLRIANRYYRKIIAVFILLTKQWDSLEYSFLNNNFNLVNLHFAVC